MENTGEQFIPGVSSVRLIEEHVKRYEFVLPECKGKSVLDIACGTGYGSSRISEIAKRVVGVDISTQAIAFASANYHKDNLNFVTGDCTNQIFPPDTFDIIISFETIEHLDTAERKKYLQNCRDYLRDDGIFILSTPNKKFTSPLRKKPANKFHKIEFTKKQLLKEIKPWFGVVEVYGQRFLPSILVSKPVVVIVRIVEKILKKDFGLYSVFSGAQVKKNNSCLLESRIIIIKMKKYGKLSMDKKAEL